mgnify:CR=1 FL=1
MGETPEIAELQEKVEQSGNSGGKSPDGGGDSGGSGGIVPSINLSKRQWLVIGAVAVVVLVVVLRERNSDGKSTSAEEVEKARDGPDLDDVTVTEEEGQEGVEVVVPQNPDDELEKDAAIIEHFKETGHMSGGSD